ncbi:MAG: hypothetical protein ACYTKD_32430, partial [Planctomycetota bacterium]
MIRTKDGRLVGIDKGQLFRFFGKDRLATTYNPNPERSLYNEAFGAYAEGKDVALAPLAHERMKGLLSKIDALPDDEFRRILSPYAKRAAKAGRLAYGTEGAFLKKVLARKKSLRVDAGDDFENMNLLAYQVEKKGLFLEGKLRAASQSKLLGRLGLNAGVAEPDGYWERVLKVAKSYNHHLGPGGDGRMSEHSVTLWRELLGELKGKRGGREQHYRKYLRSLGTARRDKVSWSKKAVGGVVEKYVAPGRTFPKELVRFAAKTTKGWDYKKQARGGRIRIAAGKRTFKGVAYDVDLGEGVKLHYIQHGDDNRFSKFGKVRIEIADESPAGVRKALEKLKGLGLDSRLAAAEDLEQLYLSKVSYAAGVADKVKVTPGMTTGQRAKAYREFWEKKLGVKDVRKLKGYSPEPHFDNDKGWARWSRFDVDPDEFERRLKGSALGHSLHEDMPGAIEAILESEGSLVSTEEKFRIGVPISGMSP